MTFHPTDNRRYGLRRIVAESPRNAPYQAVYGMLMLPPPGPSELLDPINPDCRDVERHRNLYCPSYDCCLDQAIQQRWRSWSCVHCAFFPFRYGPARIATESTSIANRFVRTWSLK